MKLKKQGFFSILGPKGGPTYTDATVLNTWNYFLSCFVFVNLDFCKQSQKYNKWKTPRTRRAKVRFRKCQGMILFIENSLLCFLFNFGKVIHTHFWRASEWHVTTSWQFLLQNARQFCKVSYNNLVSPKLFLRHAFFFVSFCIKGHGLVACPVS